MQICHRSLRHILQVHISVYFWNFKYATSFLVCYPFVYNFRHSKVFCTSQSTSSTFSLDMNFRSRLLWLPSRPTLILESCFFSFEARSERLLDQARLFGLSSPSCIDISQSVVGIHSAEMRDTKLFQFIRYCWFFKVFCRPQFEFRLIFFNCWPTLDSLIICCCLQFIEEVTESFV